MKCATCETLINSWLPLCRKCYKLYGDQLTTEWLTFLKREQQRDKRRDKKETGLLTSLDAIIDYVNGVNRNDM